MSTLSTSALEERLRSLMTAEYLARFEQEHGPFTDAEKRSAEAIWAEAERREVRRPALSRSSKPMISA